jgi:hypothetical protein
MLTKWNNKKKYYKSQWYYAIFVLIFCLHCNISSFFSHDYCMIMLYFDLLLPLFFIISSSFSPKNIYVKLFTFFFIIITVPDWVQMLTYQCVCLHCTRALIEQHWLYVVKYRKRVIHKASWLQNSLLLYIH